MSDEAEIREAASGDVEGMLDGYEWLFAPPGSEPTGWDRADAGQRLRAAMDSEDALVLVADSAGRVAGICTAYLDLLSVRFGLRCWVEDLAVDPDVRSTGIGAGLLRRAREWASERGASHLELDSGEERLDAHRFYEREGSGVRSICFGWHELGE